MMQEIWQNPAAMYGFIASKRLEASQVSFFFFSLSLSLSVNFYTLYQPYIKDDKGIF